jgi:hypothetical protein
MIPLTRLWFWVCLIGVLVMLPSAAPAYTDFSAGKTPEQIFGSDCSGCHPSSHGLARGRNLRALAGFLREHYTTKAQSARLLASYLTRPRAANSTARLTENSFLKFIWVIWRKVSAISWWLIGQLTKLLRA